MHVTVNNQTRELPEGATLADLLRACGLDRAPCAAEVNRTLVPRDRHEQTPLREGDAIELVTLVGGG